MNTNDWFYMHMFTSAIYTKTGQAFEDFFCEILKASDDDFQKVKASGKTGDRNCDGFNSKTGDYYLCYSPEDIKKELTIKNAIRKIQKDINGIVKKWSGITTINYVINDKFDGVSPQIHDLIKDLKDLHSNVKIELYSMEKLRKLCLSLEESDKQRILGYCPDLTGSKTVVDFSVISNIIEYLEKNIQLQTYEDHLFVPDFSQKISFNKLSPKIADWLNNAKYHIFRIDEFYNNTPSYDKEDLRNYLRSLYIEGINAVGSLDDNAPDKIFFYIMQKMAYNPNSKSVIDNILIIIAFFFESCDIFEKPTGEVVDEQINA